MEGKWVIVYKLTPGGVGAEIVVEENIAGNLIVVM